jgi:hypothetical protein
MLVTASISMAVSLPTPLWSIVLGVPGSFLTFSLFLAKPFILQQLIRGGPIPPIYHHYFPNELLVPLADLRLRRLVKWRCLRAEKG